VTGRDSHPLESTSLSRHTSRRVLAKCISAVGRPHLAGCCSRPWRRLPKRLSGGQESRAVGVSKNGGFSACLTPHGFLKQTLGQQQRLPHRRLIRSCTDTGHERAFFFVSSAKVAEPSLDLSHDFVNLECLQKGRFLFQLCTPCRQDRVHSHLLVIAFINNLLDGHFPFLKTHRLFLLEFGIARFDCRDETKRLYGTYIVISNSVATIASLRIRLLRDG